MAVQKTVPELMTYHAAGVLVGRIKRFWHGLGYVSVFVERYPIPGFEGLFAVRSNLVNGLPPEPVSHPVVSIGVGEP